MVGPWLLASFPQEKSRLLPQLHEGEKGEAVHQKISDQIFERRPLKI